MKLLESATRFREIAPREYVQQAIPKFHEGAQPPRYSRAMMERLLRIWR